MEWVYGKSSSSLNMKKLIDAITFVKTLEVEDENTMSPHLFAEIVLRLIKTRFRQRY